MWIARDKDNILSLYLNKPIRMDNCWSALMEDSDKWFDLPEDSFPEIKWEDEPEEVLLVMKNTLHKITCDKCGKEFKYHNSDIKEWHDYQPSSGYDYGAEYVDCPYCNGYNELSSW